MKWIRVLGLVFLTTLLSIGGTYLIMEKNYEKETSKVIEHELDSSSKEDEKKEFVSTVDSTFGWENKVHDKMTDEWKSGDEPFVDNLVEEVIQQMAHQKIIADEKEGSIMITPERIDILIQMVEENKDKYEHYETYLDVLKRVIFQQLTKIIMF